MKKICQRIASANTYSATVGVEVNHINLGTIAVRNDKIK